MEAPKVEVRLNNCVFYCGIDGKIYNIFRTKAYAIGIVKTLQESPQHPNMLAVPVEPFIICENCYNENKDKGLMFKDPSNIILPQPDLKETEQVIKEVIQRGPTSTRN